VLHHSFRRNVAQILEIYQEILVRRGGLPHGYQVLGARVRGEGIERGALAGTRLRDILGAGVKP
jgi:hypothetical protein